MGIHLDRTTAAPTAYGDVDVTKPHWFCRYCSSIHQDLANPEPRECPVPGCTNPYGSGRWADTPRPRAPSRSGKGG